MYFELIPNAFEFKYLIAAGQNDNHLEVFVEKYTRDEVETIDNVIRRFYNWLEENDLMELYKSHWEIERK